jgi:hypothetical protein
MIKKFEDFEEFKQAARDHKITSDLESLQDLDIVFFEDYERYMILSLPAVNSAAPNQILILSKEFNIAYCPGIQEKYKKLKLSKLLRPWLLFLRAFFDKEAGEYPPRCP